jgi:acyl carrier protein
MDVSEEVIRVLDQVLSLHERAKSFTRDTHLLGSVPELDSMAVVSLLTTLEERCGVAIEDDIDGSAFRTVGTLADFVSARLGRA